MRLPMTLTVLLGAALLSSTAWAQSSPPEKPMKSADKSEKSRCGGDARDKGNAGTAYGPGAKAVGGSGNRGRDTGNGGVAVGRDADASGGDNNTAHPRCADGARLGNGGVAKGRDAKANGGNGNVVNF